jgi:transketolase
MALHDKQMREVYAATLGELIDKNPAVLCLEADLAKATGTALEIGVKRAANFVNCGIQEANMIGVAAGLAREGKIPFCATFACFAARRAYDQAFVSVGYADMNVKIVGTDPGLTPESNGGTHMFFGDLGIMRVIPGMKVFSPCDVYELRSMLRYMAADHSPTYMQLYRGIAPKVFDEDYAFDPDKLVRLTSGDDLTLVSTGYMTPAALQAARALAAEGLGVDLLHCPSVKPFDAATFLESAGRTRCVVTVENGDVACGLGGLVCEICAESLPTPVTRLGIKDSFGEVGTIADLLDKHGLTPEHITDACRTAAGRRNQEA